MNEKIFIGSQIKTYSGRKGIVIGKTTTYDMRGEGIIEAETVIVLLDEGFWSEDRETYVTSLCVHPSNITIVHKEIEDENQISVLKWPKQRKS